MSDRPNSVSPSSVVGLFYAGSAHGDELAAANIDVSRREPMNDLLRRAVAEGHGEHSISALVELLRKPGPGAARSFN